MLIYTLLFTPLLPIEEKRKKELLKDHWKIVLRYFSDDKVYFIILAIEMIIINILL